MLNSKTGLRRQLLLTTALVIPGLIGYGGRKAYGACNNNGGTTYLCSGNETNPQTISANDAAVTMDAGATVDTRGSGGNAITITGDGALSFTNTAGGAISGAENGLSMSANTGGSISVSTTQSISGGDNGIYARNGGTGALTIEAVDVTGTGGDGIFAWTGTGGTADLNITTTGTVTGDIGINAQNYGTGALTIQAFNVTGTGNDGIYARTNGTDLNITTTGPVTGDLAGINARNFGSGALTIIANDVTGTTGNGIFAYNYETGTDVNVTTGGTITGDIGINAVNDGTGALTITSTGTVTGGTGISADNQGTGALTINAVDVTGTTGTGIYALNSNSGTDLSITTTGMVTSSYYGISANNQGTGALTISAVDVTDTYVYGTGISAYNLGTDLSITSTGTVTGSYSGIRASNRGSGALTIDVNNVTSTYGYGTGISAFNRGTNLSITSTGTVTGGYYGISAVNDGTGALTINVNNVSGTNEDGIYGRSGAAGATITVTGAVFGGDNGIHLYSGGDTVINIAAGASVTGGSHAIDTNYGGIAKSNDTVNLRGGIDGNVALGKGDDVFRVFFDTAGFGPNTTLIDGGDDIDTLALRGTVTGAELNAGLGFIEGFENVRAENGSTIVLAATDNVAFAGNVIFDSGAILNVAVDGDANTNGAINVTGTASVGGKIVPTVTGAVASGAAITIVNAAGGVTDTGLSVDDTVGFDFEVAAGGTTVVLTIEEVVEIVDIVEVVEAALAEGGTEDVQVELLNGQVITVNEKSVAAYLDALTGNGAISADLIALLNGLRNLPDAVSLVQALKELIPSNMTGHLDSAIHGNLALMNAGFSCGVSEGANAIVAEGQCIWAKVTGRYKEHDATRKAFAFDEQAGGISGGAQFNAGGELRVGFAVNYEQSETDVARLSKTDGERVQGGLIIKNRWGGSTLGVAFTGGKGWLESERFISVPTFTGTASSDQDISFAGVKIRAAHLFEMGSGGALDSWYLKPQVDLNFQYVKLDGYRERGAGGLGLVVASMDETILSFSPGLELGGELRLDQATLMRPWVRVGATVFQDTSTSISANFAGAPTGVIPFQFTSELDKTSLDLATGVNVLWNDALELRLNYDGRFSENSREHSAGAKIGMRF